MSTTTSTPSAVMGELAEARARVERLEAQLSAALEHRDELIVRASESASRAQVAEVAGLTRGRVQQVVTASRTPRAGGRRIVPAEEGA